MRAGEVKFPAELNIGWAVKLGRVRWVTHEGPGGWTFTEHHYQIHRPPHCILVTAWWAECYYYHIAGRTTHAQNT